MKKFLYILVIMIFSGLIIFAGMKFFQSVFFAEPNVIQKVSSPDGRYTAYVFESNGGATTGWIYHISILKSEKKLNRGNGNVYISGIPPNNIEWIENTILYVDDYKSIKTTKQKQKLKDVIIKYKSLE